MRTLSGLSDETNIIDENIKSKIIIATGMINSAIWYIYSLPLSYRYQNTITFSGTASNTYSLNFVINWTTYTIGMVNGDTWSSLADKFRVVAWNSDDFYVDDLWTWAVVYITSKSILSDWYEEVNITSTTSHDGITTSSWTRVKRFPSVIEQITAEIATALLFIDVYWIEAQDTWKDGPTRMDRINETLQKLQWSHESWQQIRIFDEYTHAEISMSTWNATLSYPNDTSDVSTSDSTSPKIFINKQF